MGYWDDQVAKQDSTPSAPAAPPSKPGFWDGILGDKVAPGGLSGLITGEMSPVQKLQQDFAKSGPEISSAAKFVAGGEALGAGMGIAANAMKPVVGKIGGKIAESIGQMAENNPYFRAQLETTKKAISDAYVAWHRTFTTGIEKLNRWAPITKTLLSNARDEGSFMAGKLVSDYNKATKGLTAYEKAVMGGIIEGKLSGEVATSGPAIGRYTGIEGLVRPGMEKQVVEASRAVEGQLRDVGALLKEHSIPVNDGDGLHQFELLRDYIPHRIVNMLQYTIPGPIQDEAVKSVLKANVVGREAAQQMAVDAEMRTAVARAAIRRAKAGTFLRGASQDLREGMPTINTMVKSGQSPEAIDAMIEQQTKLAAKKSLQVNTQELTQAKALADRAKELAAKNVITTREEAVDYLNSIYRQSTGLSPRAASYGGGVSRSPHLMARILNLPGYEMNPEFVIPQYMESVGRRISLAKNFGPLEQMPEFSPEEMMSMTPKTLSARQQYPRAFEEVDKMPQGPIRDATERTISDYLGRAKENPWWGGIANRISTAQVITKLARGAIMQPSQMLTSIVRTGVRGSWSNFIKTMKDDPEALDFSLRAGVTLHGAVRAAEEALYGGGSVGEKFLNSVKFTQFDMKSRIFGALQGQTMAEAAATKFANLASIPVKTAKDEIAFSRLGERLSKLGIDPESVIVNGGKLTDQQMLKAASTVSHDVNFWGDSLSLPEAFATPSGRFWLQFKSFAVQQFVMMKNHVTKPALEYIQSGGARGDIQPLVRTLTVLPAGGEILQDIRALAQNRQRRSMGLVERYLDNLVAASTFGIMGDAFQATQNGLEGSLSFLAGPAVSTAGKGMAAIGDASKGNFKTLGRFGIREVMALGGAVNPAVSVLAPAIENAAFPSEKSPPFIAAH